MPRTFDDFLYQNKYRMFVASLYLASAVALYVAVAGGVSAWWLLVSLIWGKALAGIGNNIAMHRYFSHRSFDTTPARASFLAWATVLLGLGTIAQYASSHRAHHKASDTPNDLHSPRNDGALKTMFGLWELHETGWYVQRGKANVRDVIADPACRFINRHYYRIWAVLVAVSLLISWEVTLYLLFLPTIVVRLSMNIFINYLGHRWGYQNFDAGDGSRNNKLTAWWTLGCSFHNNHHMYPYLWKFSVKSGELDASGWIIEKLFAVPGPATARGKMCIDGQPAAARPVPGYPAVTS